MLLGDAAHTMSPVWGQGLNSGLEDVAVFAHIMKLLVAGCPSKEHLGQLEEQQQLGDAIEYCIYEVANSICLMITGLTHIFMLLVSRFA